LGLRPGVKFISTHAMRGTTPLAPGTIVSYGKMAAAAVTGTRPDKISI
jgi:hypothetical protein